jgi:hypothetical protein
MLGRAGSIDRENTFNHCSLYSRTPTTISLLRKAGSRHPLGLADAQALRHRCCRRAKKVCRELLRCRRAEPRTTSRRRSKREKVLSRKICRALPPSSCPCWSAAKQRSPGPLALTAWRIERWAATHTRAFAERSARRRGIRGVLWVIRFPRVAMRE